MSSGESGIGVERVFVFLDGVGHVLGLAGVDRFFLVDIRKRGVIVGLGAVGVAQSGASVGFAGAACGWTGSASFTGAGDCALPLQSRRRRREDGGQRKPKSAVKCFDSHHSRGIHRLSEPGQTWTISSRMPTGQSASRSAGSTCLLLKTILPVICRRRSAMQHLRLRIWQTYHPVGR